MKVELYLIKTIAGINMGILKLCLRLIERRERRMWKLHLKHSKRHQHASRKGIALALTEMTNSVQRDDLFSKEMMLVNELTNILENARDDFKDALKVA